MCSQIFNSRRFWCNKIADTLQLLSSGNTGVICPEHSSPETEWLQTLWTSLLSQASCSQNTDGQGKLIFPLLLVRGLVKKSSLFFLAVFFDQLFCWRLNGIQMFSLWSCILGLSQVFAVGTYFLWMFFILYSLLSGKLYLQTMGLHIIVIRQGVRRKTVHSKEVGSFCLLKTNLGLIFP